MTPNDIQEFNTILNGLYSMYNQKEPMDFVKQMWMHAMKPYDMKAIRQAFSAHITNPDNGQFMPKPADIVRLIGGTNTDKALIAWTSVEDAVRKIGTYEDVCFSDPIIHCVISDMGGWISLGTKSYKEWDFVKNEFVTRYRAISAMPVKPKAPNLLVGIANTQNATNGYRIKPPVLIGDKQKALLVYQNGNSPKTIQIQRLTA